MAAIPLPDALERAGRTMFRQKTSDFADWLSPMLVKELRQGMRTRLFVGSFILLQISMTLNVIVGLLVAADQRDPSFSTGIFWAIVAIPVMFILPLSGLGAVSNEMNANTLELVFLTRLSAWRIVAGKWFALVAQAVLLICAVLPYAVLRYFVGGVNVTEELITLALMLAASAVLCSVTVGISPYQTRLTRALLVIGLVFFAWAIVPALVFARFSTFGFSSAHFTWGLGIALAVCALLFLFLMLEIGASRIAPPAENHSAKKRGFTFASFLLALLFSVVLPDSKMITSLAMLLALPVCIDALCEQPRWIPSIFRPFARRGLVGRLLGRFAYPGWPSGVAFTIVMLGAFAALMVKQQMLDYGGAYLTYISLCGALLLPAALIRLLFPRTQKALALFIGFQAISVALTILALLIDQNELFKFSMRKVVSVLPTSTLMMTSGLGLPEESEPFFRTVTSVVTVLSVLVLFVFIPAAWKRMRELEDESLQAPVPHAAVA